MIKGKHIKEMRDKLHKTQADVANEADVTIMRVSQVERQPEREVPESFRRWHADKITEIADRG